MIINIYQISIIRNLHNNIVQNPADFYYLIQNISEIALINKTEKKIIMKGKLTSKGKDKKTIMDKGSDLNFFLFSTTIKNKEKYIV